MGNQLQIGTEQTPRINCITESHESCSVLFEPSELWGHIEPSSPPDCFGDLNLDQVIDTVTSGREQYELKPFFYRPLHSVNGIKYRLAVFQDLEAGTLANDIRSFSDLMIRMRKSLDGSRNRYYKQERQGSFLSAVKEYVKGVELLASSLEAAELQSTGLQQYRDCLRRYRRSSDYGELIAATGTLSERLATVRYTVQISGARITVARYTSGRDYGAEVAQTFGKFSHDAPKQYKLDVISEPEMNHIEAAITDMVAKLYLQVFEQLEAYHSRYRDYCEAVISRFDREIQFYLAYRDYVQTFRAAGLPFCYPAVSACSKEVRAEDAFDVALATKLSRNAQRVVTNDFRLEANERILIISGPNQGGKTTFARMFGQMHYLASVGCPVPGTKANLFLYDNLFTHFEREEQLCDLQGKLERELRRMHAILCAATDRTILIMNESFLSTTVHDALVLNTRVLDRVRSLDMLCVAVTFLDELVSLSETVVSMASCVDPGDPSIRTFRVLRQALSGQVYAINIAEKYGLTYQAVKMRIAEHAKPEGLQ